MTMVLFCLLFDVRFAPRARPPTSRKAELSFPCYTLSCTFTLWTRLKEASVFSSSEQTCLGDGISNQKAFGDALACAGAAVPPQELTRAGKLPASACRIPPRVPDFLCWHSIPFGIPSYRLRQPIGPSYDAFHRSCANKYPALRV